MAFTKNPAGSIKFHYGVRGCVQSNLSLVSYAKSSENLSARFDAISVAEVTADHIVYGTYNRGQRVNAVFSVDFSSFAQ
jgi:hypothetical protein